MIYVVDDHEINVELLAELLGQKGYSVRTFTDALESWEQTQIAPPDLLLLDVMMPGLDGITFCRRVKQELAAAFIPVILITAWEEKEARAAGLEAGADDFITKPFDQMELLVKVRNYLRGKTLYDQLQTSLNQAERQLTLAAEVQKSLFVPSLQIVQDLGAELLYYPSGYLSGDVVDLQPRQDGTLIFMADVSGHGVDAALLACSVKLLFSQISHSTSCPQEILHLLNEATVDLLAENTAGYYVTAICAFINSDSLSIAAAGHPLALLAASGEIIEFGDAGLPLGVYPSQTYPLAERGWAGLDWVLFYTDGLAQAVDLQQLHSANLQSWLSTTQQVIQQLAAADGLQDDVTAVVVCPN